MEHDEHWLNELEALANSDQRSEVRTAARTAINQHYYQNRIIASFEREIKFISLTHWVELISAMAIGAIIVLLVT